MTGAELCERLFQSTPPRGGRLQQCLQPPVRPVISIHAPREGGDRPYLRLGLGEGISIHAPARGATQADHRLWHCIPNFNPRPPRGGRRARSADMSTCVLFQSTPPARGATSDFQRRIPFSEFQSTPPAKGATYDMIDATSINIISIHAPREGGDNERRATQPAEANFNPRPPRRGRLHAARAACWRREFQSTPPRGGRHHPYHQWQRRGTFQSTPPRGGRHYIIILCIYYFPYFNPRPREGGDQASRPENVVDGISIHAPARGATPHGRSAELYKTRFQSTPPRGGRPAKRLEYQSIRRAFQSTPPRGGRHCPAAFQYQPGAISIHAPARGATVTSNGAAHSVQISIHAPARGATEGWKMTAKSDGIFQSTPPRGGRHQARRRNRHAT